MPTPPLEEDTMGQSNQQIVDEWPVAIEINDNKDAEMRHGEGGEEASRQWISVASCP